MARALFAACNPIQLLAAICIRTDEEKCDTYSNADLVIAPKFPGATSLVDDRQLNRCFDRIALFDPFAANYFPQVKDYCDYRMAPEKHRERFFELWPFGGDEYSAFYSGDPHMILWPRLYLSAGNSRTILFDEGIGTYNGAVAAFFCMKSRTPFAQCIGRGKRAFVKELIKRLPMIGSSNGDGYFIAPTELFLFDPACYQRGSFGDRENVSAIRVPPVESLKGSCDYLREAGLGISGIPKEDVKAVYLATWFDNVSENDQRRMVETIARSTHGKVLVKPHPRHPFSEPFSTSGVILAPSNCSWEMLCLDNAVGDDTVLYGCCSTAQVLPRILAKMEPVVVVLDALLGSCSISRDANYIIGMLKERYSDPSRIIVPASMEQLLGELDAISDMASGR